MTKFLFVYRHNTQSYGSTSPEEMQQMYQKWQAWVAEGFKMAGCSTLATG
jgi:hypothetical protein